MSKEIDEAERLQKGLGGLVVALLTTLGSIGIKKLMDERKERDEMEEGSE